MIGRTFIDLDKEISLEEILGNFLKLSRKAFLSNSREKVEYILEKVDKGELKDFFISGKNIPTEREFVPVIFHIKIKEEYDIPELNSSRTDVIIRKAKRDVDERIYFWLFRKNIILSKASLSRKFLIPILNEALNMEILIPKYDINKIYDNYKSSDFIRSYLFDKRNNTARSGSLYLDGPFTTSDIVIKETDKAYKKGITLFDLPENGFKFSVYETGSVVINNSWYDFNKYLEDFKKIKNFLKSYEIK